MAGQGNLRAQLTIKEAAELNRALGDGFVAYGGSRSMLHPIRLLVDDPFFEAVVRGGHDAALATLPGFIEEMKNDGSTNDEIEDAYRDYLDDNVPDDAPHWRETNPFGFDLAALREFFTARYNEHYGSEPYSVEDGLWPGSFLICEEPYSKVWFELLALAEIQQLDSSISELRQDNKRAANGFYLMVAFRYAGSIGRIIEQYCWRFSHGADTLRGKVSVSAARTGGETRARAHAALSEKILSEMQRQVQAGKTVSNAARLAFKFGLGASPGANRKLWYRNTRK